MKEKKPIQEKPKPQKIEELGEATEEEVKAAVVAEEEIMEEPLNEPQETPEEVDKELTEEQVKGWMKDVAVVLNEQNRRFARIEHHLRIDFD